MAAALGAVAVVKRALKKAPQRAAETDPLIRMEFGPTPLPGATQRPCTTPPGQSSALATVAGLLLECGAPLDASDVRDDRGGTPMGNAIQTSNNLKLVRVLLEHGNNFKSCVFEGVLGQLPREDPGQQEIADMIWESGDIDQGGVRQRGVHGYARQAMSKIVVWLLEHGIDVNQRDEGGRSALHWVGERQAIAKMARILLERGAELEPVDDAGNTPLDLAILNERVKVVDFLRSRGATRLRSL